MYWPLASKERLSPAMPGSHFTPFGVDRAGRREVGVDDLRVRRRDDRVELTAGQRTRLALQRDAALVQLGQGRQDRAQAVRGTAELGLGEQAAQLA